MSTFAQAALFLIQTIGGLYLYVLLLRLLLPLVRADFYNPISQFVVKLTRFPLNPLHRLIPSVGPLDVACLLLAIVVQVLIYIAILTLQGASAGSIFPLLLLGLTGLADRLLDIYFFGIIVLIIVSWVAPHSNHPALSLLRQVIEPAMSPLRRIIPPMGGLDLSPMLAIMAIYLLRIFLKGFQQWLFVG